MLLRIGAIRQNMQKWLRSLVNHAATAEMLPVAEFYSELLTAHRSLRAEYFKEMKEKLATCKLIIFDPDNGIETKSIAKGRRNSEKYVYWDEIGESFQVGHSFCYINIFDEKNEQRLSSAPL
jgi:hypothetical protein